MLMLVWPNLSETIFGCSPLAIACHGPDIGLTFEVRNGRHECRQVAGGRDYSPRPRKPSE